MISFSDNSFESTNWINNTFSSIDSNLNKETIASNVVFKLQLLVQEVNNSLEETAQQMIHNLPKVMRETESLQKDSCLLREQMKTIKEKLNKIESESSKSMQTLINIDVVKKRMQETCKALQEADNWTTLSSDVEEVFLSADINAISKKLIGMQNSLEILIDVSDYEQRVQHLEGLKDRLESMLEPSIISGFMSQTLDSAHFYVKLFKDIKRMAKLKSYYHKCIKNQILSEWTRIVRLDPEENIMDWLNGIYDSLLSLWHSQINFCLQIIFPNDFESTIEILCDIFVDVFSSLDPSITSCINEFIEKQNNPRESIQFVIEMKQFTYRFAKSIELSLTSNSSNSNKILNKPNVELLAQILYSPYREIMDNYTELEKQTLIHDLENIKAISQPSESLSKAFTYAKDVEKRCHQFTQSVAIPSLLPVLENYFKDYLQHFKSMIDDIRAKSSENDNKSSIPDWSLFQLSLFTLQASGELVVQIELFQQQLFASLIDVSKKVSPLSSETMSPFNRFDDLILNPYKKKELTDLINVLIQSESPSIILESIYTECKNICSLTASVVMDIALNYIESHLNDVSKLVSTSFQENSLSCEEEDMHSFSLSPQEYITQIGQYLLTIPQHLEPFVLQENIAFKVALKYCEIIKNYSCEANSSDSTAAEYLLDCITQRTIEAYINRILKLKKLTFFAKQQLITDISYLCDVLDDLGLTPGEQFQLLLKLLKASPEEFKSITRNSNAMIVKVMETLLSK